MASMPSSLHPTGFAEMILTFTILLDIVCLLAVGLRTWQRVKERNFWIDDGLTWLGLIFNLFQYGVVAWGTTVGIGTPDSIINQNPKILLQAAKVIYWLNVTYLLAIGFIKASICSTLLRINKGSSQRGVNWALWLTMVAIVLSALGELITFLVRCDPSGGCKDSNQTIAILQWIGVAVFIALDLALAIVPVFIIHGLKMRKSMKLSTGFILGLGGIACLGAILRIPSQIEAVGKDGKDELYKIGSFVLWSEIETGLGIIASCLPMLRKLLRSFDAQSTAVVPGEKVNYTTPNSDHSGQTPTNKIQSVPYDSYLVPEYTKRKKGDWTQTSCSSDGITLALQPTYSSRAPLRTNSGGRAQNDWVGPNSTGSTRGLAQSTREVDELYLYGHAS
ncbi:hypothetical protein VSDG_06695 [Cytospora chrysosperma]|uniref:Rhodopsin domain-containing protein n=1 Tax=Cytospora chrysosperma TaxID=252740 RepID=A0A423VNF6_CYTCH|nr:hypothetical protein VSDG_06695 [Valsa sordida]